MKAKFALGPIVATPAALKVLEANHVSSLNLIHRHMSGDWGDLEGLFRRYGDDCVWTDVCGVTVLDERCV